MELNKFSPSNVRTVLSCFVVVKGMLPSIVGEGRRIRPVFVEALMISQGVLLETLVMPVSLETPRNLVEPRVQAGSDRETTEGQ
jgi:hypothetical protein